MRPWDIITHILCAIPAFLHLQGETFSLFKEFHPRKKIEILEIVEQSICKPMYNYDQVSRENAKYHLECESG